jgi:hypothetical protein
VLVDGDAVGPQGICFGASKGTSELYVIDAATWAASTPAKRNKCTIQPNGWHTTYIDALANMTGYSGGGETCYLCVRYLDTHAACNTDPFTYGELPP